MTKKRILSAFISALMVLSLISNLTFAASSLTVTAENKEIMQGTTSASVAINVSNNPGIAVLGFDIGYDSGVMKLTKVTIGTAVFSNADVTAGDLSKNPYTFSAFNAEANKTGNGLLATLDFTINADCPAKTYDITLANGEAYTLEEDVVDVKPVKGSIKVTKKPIKGVTFSDKEFTYDGKEKQISVSGNLPSGAKVDYTANKGTDAGIYNATAVVRADGYDDLTLTAKMTIKPKSLTVSGLKAENKTYDGTTTAEIKGGSLSGKLSDDDVDASFPKTGVFANANVGNNIAVSIEDVILTGSKKGNYTLTQPKGLKANITKAPISVKANDVTIVKGEAIPALGYTITSGRLFGEDKITGAPATSAKGNKLGTFDITKGTLAVGSNYSLTFTKGQLTVVDKTVQNITVSEITEKTYGDKPFAVTVTPDAESKLTEFTFESSKTDVAEIAEDGTVTIKAAGETDITVKQAGNDEYAAFTKTQKLVVKKVAVTITADAKMKKIGAEDPELTYKTEGELVSGDSITGRLERKSGEAVGKYEILIGTLAINNNYDITYNKAIFEIVDKTPQNITVSAVEEKTYGDTAFAVSAVPDSTAKLNAFTFESTNTDVAEIAADGTVTIKAAGETDIVVKQAGNDEYAPFEKSQKLVVNKKAVTVASINADEKTAVINGILDGDTAVALDFDKLNIEIRGVASETTSDVAFTNLALTGEKSENYTVATESVIGVIITDNIVKVTVAADNGTVEGAGSYIKGSRVVLTAAANSGYKFSGWYVGDSAVSTEAAYAFTADADTDITAKFTRRSSGGGGSGSSSYCTVKFETDNGTKISSRSVKKNASLEAPSAPTKEGYTFAGWYTDKELTQAYDFGAKVTKSFTLYAKWEKSEDLDEADSLPNQIVFTINSKTAKVFGETKTNDVAPIIRNDRAMLPARFVAENLGAKVEWDGTAPGTVTITKDDIKIVIYIGEESALVNDERVKLDSPAFIENDRTYTPVRFVAEKLGADVEWLEETQKVIVTK